MTTFFLSPLQTAPRAAQRRLSDAFDHAQQALAQHGSELADGLGSALRATDRRTRGAIASYPWEAVAVAAAAGLVLGWCARHFAAGLFAERAPRRAAEGGAARSRARRPARSGS